MCPYIAQHFTVVNIDKREQGSFTAGTLRNFLFGDETDRIFFHLLRLTVTFKTSGNDKDATEADVRATCFPKFPAETLSHIFDEIDDIKDCFSLAFTSKRCWLVGQLRMKALILDRATQWAGDRIICIGEYHIHRDLPPNILSPEEQEILDLYHEENHQTYYDNSLTTYCDTRVSRTAYQPYTLLSRLAREHLPSQYQRQLSKYVSIGYRQPEILRNISKRQYVRRSALWAMAKTCPKHWRWDLIDLGHIVLSRICWSSVEEIYLRHHIHRGVWAGDRFDITSADALDEMDENGLAVEWTDVTDEVLNEMFKIWMKQFGGGTFQFMSSASRRCI